MIISVKWIVRFLEWMDEHRLFIVVPIIGIVASAGIFIWNEKRIPPEPEPLTAQTQPGSYCAIEIQALSRWWMKTDYDTYYFAADAGGKLYAITLNDEQYEECAEIVAYTYSDRTGSVPEPVQFTGYLQSFPEETLEMAADSFGMTRGEYVCLYGETVFNAKKTPNTDRGIVAIVIFGASILILALQGIAKIDELLEQRRSQNKK